MSLQDFSSLPPHEEQAFVVFEARTQNLAASANRLAMIVSVVALIITFFVVFGFGSAKAPPGTSVEPAAEAKPK